MTQGLPLHKSADHERLSRKIARSRDTLHILVLLLRRQAEARGDGETVALIDETLARMGEGDAIKMELVERMQD